MSRSSQASASLIGLSGVPSDDDDAFVSSVNAITLGHKFAARMAWTNLGAHAVASWTRLSHSGGGDTWVGVGGNSTRSLSGDGYVQLSTASAATYSAAGLVKSVHVPTATWSTDLDFAIFFMATGTIDTIDGGVQMGVGAAFTPADKFRILRTGSVAVAQQQVGGVGAWLTRYTYLASPSGLLTVGALIFSDGASVAADYLSGNWR